MSSRDTLDFKPLFITEVFTSMKAAGKWFDLDKATSRGSKEFPYIARSGGDNGVGAYLPHQDFDPPNEGNAITIGVSTSTVFYQPVPFYTSKEIQVLRHPRLSALNGPILVAILRKQMSKFQWGNGASLARLRATRIMVPVIISDKGDPAVDWDGMTRLGEELFSLVKANARRARQSKTADDILLPDLSFKPRLLTEVFTEYRQAPSWYNTNQIAPGNRKYPHVTNSAANNSVSGFIARQAKDPNPGNAITVGIDTQVVAYQPVPFYGATKVFTLRSPYLTEINAPILVAALKKSVEKFSWGYKASAARLKRTRILVPVTYSHEGQEIIDWDGMNRYGLALRSQTERRLDPVIEAPLELIESNSRSGSERSKLSETRLLF
jgi:hypothetical protein